MKKTVALLLSVLFLIMAFAPLSTLAQEKQIPEFLSYPDYSADRFLNGATAVLEDGAYSYIQLTAGQHVAEDYNMLFWTEMSDQHITAADHRYAVITYKIASDEDLTGKTLGKMALRMAYAANETGTKITGMGNLAYNTSKETIVVNEWAVATFDLQNAFAQMITLAGQNAYIGEMLKVQFSDSYLPEGRMVIDSIKFYSESDLPANPVFPEYDVPGNEKDVPEYLSYPDYNTDRFLNGATAVLDDNGYSYIQLTAGQHVAEEYNMLFWTEMSDQHITAADHRYAVITYKIASNEDLTGKTLGKMALRMAYAANETGTKITGMGDLAHNTSNETIVVNEWAVATFDLQNAFAQMITLAGQNAYIGEMLKVQFSDSYLPAGRMVIDSIKFYSESDLPANPVFPEYDVPAEEQKPENDGEMPAVISPLSVYPTNNGVFENGASAIVEGDVTVGIQLAGGTFGNTDYQMTLWKEMGELTDLIYAKYYRYVEIEYYLDTEATDAGTMALRMAWWRNETMGDQQSGLDSNLVHVVASEKNKTKEWATATFDCQDLFINMMKVSNDENVAVGGMLKLQVSGTTLVEGTLKIKSIKFLLADTPNVVPESDPNETTEPTTEVTGPGIIGIITEAPRKTSEVPTDTVGSDKTAESGCSSTISGMTVALSMSIVAGFSFVVRKKKK